MKYEFSSPREMLEEIQAGTDLFCPDECLYVFLYSDDGAICSYRIGYWDALKLQDMAEEFDDYWGAFLGTGGSIYDDPSHDGFNPKYASNMDFCEEYYRCEWIDCEDVTTMQGD